MYFDWCIIPRTTALPAFASLRRCNICLVYLQHRDSNYCRQTYITVTSCIVTEFMWRPMWMRVFADRPLFQLLGPSPPYSENLGTSTHIGYPQPTLERIGPTFVRKNWHTTMSSIPDKYLNYPIFCLYFECIVHPLISFHILCKTIKGFSFSLSPQCQIYCV